MSIFLDVKKLIDISERASSTVNSTGIVPSYSEWMVQCFNSVPRGIGIFPDLMEKIDIIENEAIRSKSKKFIVCFNKILTEHCSDVNVLLPQLKLSELDDHSALYEWCFQHARCGFRIESDDAESYWYLIAKINGMDINISGDFNNANMGHILYIIISIFLGGVKNGISRPVHSWNYKRTIYDRRCARFGVV